jgi:TRAP-type C4-dicarboxylate transport system permease small subunit
VRNSSILFLVAFLVLGWFGAEVYTAQNICVTTCISLSGLTGWEQGIAVAVLPVVLVIGGIRARQNEKKTPVAEAQTG